MRSLLSSGRANPAAFRAALPSAPPAELDAWVGAAFGLRSRLVTTPRDVTGAPGPARSQASRLSLGAHPMSSSRLLPAVLAALAVCACQPVEAPPAASASSALALTGGVAAEPLWDEALARPRLISGRFEAKGATVEETARAFLAANAAAFRLDDPSLKLELLTTREGLAGTYLRFGQLQDSLPVFDGEVIVLVSRTAPATVLAANLAQREWARTAVPHGDLGAERAQALALAAVAAAPPFTVPVEATLGVWAPLARRDGTRAAPAVAWRVRAATAQPLHDWEVLVDAASGAVLATRDRLWRVTGTGMVFDANPVASTGDTTLRDNNDATNATLDGARYSVMLPRLDGSGYLRGTYVDAQGSTRAQSASNDFSFTRNQSPQFEETMAYYHLDRTQDRFQTALGITNANNRMQVVNVNGQTADNSNYSPSTRDIIYGTGGVDDAEDSDIIVHEYGHATQDNQVPNFGAGGDEGSMGEGFGDYLGASMGDTLAAAAGHTQVADPACVGDWDAKGYNPVAACLRRTDGKKHYPEAEDGEVHDDGEMWSAGLWGIRAQLGADTTDKLVLEGHFLMSTSDTFEAASTAIVTADTNVFAGAHTSVIRRRLIQQGLTRFLSTVSPGAVTSSIPVSVDPPRVGGVYANKLDTTAVISVPGATALALHFTSVDLEVDNTCYQSSCDNIYVTNADGDLYQVAKGAQTNITSPPIAGDTAYVRLVTDPSVQKTGYHIDRVDVYGATDGGVIIDGGTGGAAGGGTGGGSTGGGTGGGSAGGGTGGGSAGGGTGGGSAGGGTGGGAAGGGAGGGSGAGTGGGGPSSQPVLLVNASAYPIGPSAPSCGCTTGLDSSASLLLALGLLIMGRRRRMS